MIPEDAIRLRSYLIWQKAGCPEGKALEHWRQAKDELQAEPRAGMFNLQDCQRRVIPRPPIMKPPQRLTSVRVAGGEWRIPIAARR